MKTITQYILENKKVTAYILCGIPGAGKSTYIKKYLKDKTIVSRDSIRAEIGYTKSADEKVVLDYRDENKVTTEQLKQIKTVVNSGEDIVIDDTNTVIKYRKVVINFLRDLGCKIIGINIITPLEICMKRREKQIPKTDYERIIRKYNPIKKDEVDELINYEGDK